MEKDKDYLEVETRYLPMGGETCAVSERSGCDTALEELSRFHWSYLNIDYHPDVLEGFEDEGCMDEIRQRLGYRLVLRSSSVSGSARPGFAFQASVVLANEGWAAPMNSRPVRLVLRHRESGAVAGVTLPEDPRTWLPEADSGPVYIDYEVCTPTGLPEGKYDIYLHLPDAASDLADKPAYSIRLANPDRWEPQSGYNRLNDSIRIRKGASRRTCTSGLKLS